jgi:hypothetical protein
MQRVQARSMIVWWVCLRFAIEIPALSAAVTALARQHRVPSRI